MRIIAGSARGLKLKTLDGLTTRPTADRVKEALFSSLSAKLTGSFVLDAFAGSGALGLEALSRGAASAVFIENNRDAFGVLRENIVRSRLERHADAKLCDVMAYIEKTSEKFDIIFLDPPYASGLYELFLVKAEKKLKPDGIIVLEYEEKNAPVIPDAFTVIKQKHYGRVHLSFLSGVEQH